VQAHVVSLKSTIDWKYTWTLRVCCENLGEILKISIVHSNLGGILKMSTNQKIAKSNKQMLNHLSEIWLMIVSG
jgi:hypothetical protein